MENLEKELVSKVTAYDPNADVKALKEGFKFAMKAHETQKRASGDPYFYHPVAVAMILADMKLDVSTIISALLHDTVEDTEVSLEDIEKSFGDDIAKLVDGVTKLTKIEYQPEHIRQAENFRKLLVAMSEDIRILLIKLADRLHNMRTLHYVKSHDKRVRIAHETMEIYAPLAERIGIQQMKNELQDLAFTELYPEARDSIISRLKFLRKEGETIVERIITHLRNTIGESGIKAEVIGREKTPCSIWRKMERKNVGFEQLSDIIGFRIIVEDIQSCYAVLGVVHAAYHMIPDSFKDFVSTPKANGYQSLHTVVMGPEQQRIEIQIRTQDMQEVAELGVAAHWCYKQGQNFQINSKQYRWIRELLYILENASSPEDFLENTKLEMYYDQVFCFTPKGDLVALPRGATPVDFAYAVHSDVGNSCVGAKINGRIVPLRTELDNGDQVEVITSKTQVPSPAWEKFVVTGKARSEIRRFVRGQQREEYVNLGRAIVSRALRDEGHELSDKIMEPLLGIFKKKKIDDIYAQIGEGLITKEDVIKALFPHKKPKETRKSLFSLLHFKGKPAIDKDHAIPIKGMIPGMAMHFGGCCHPLPGDKIVGIVNTGKGITIHTTDCEMLANFADTPERWIDVSWEKDSNDENHIGRIKAVLTHEPGSLATLANTIAKDLGNISNFRITSRSADFFEIMVDVEVRGAQHLSNIIASLRSESCIHSVERYRS